MDTSKGVAIGSAVSAANAELNHCSIDEINDEEWLIISKRDSKSRLLPRRMIFVGRQDCDICVPSTTVDMRHAVLFFNGHHFHIKDLNSAYGTYVNDKRIGEQCYVRLQHSDRLRFGFGPDLFIIEKISSLPLSLPLKTSAGSDPQLNSSEMESLEKTQNCEQRINDKTIENVLREGLTTSVSRINCENHSNSSLSNSVDSLEDMKSIKLIKDSKNGCVSDKKEEELPEINEERSKEVTTSSPSTPAPDSCGPTAFIITFDDDNENKKKLNIKDSIRQFAPPKPDSIEKPRTPKTDRKETIKTNKNVLTNEKSPTNRSKRQTNAMSAHKTKTNNKVVNTHNTPTSNIIDTCSENSGHLSDSATYLINRLLSNPTKDNLIQTNMRSYTKSPITSKADSGLSDDIKSDSGNTYTLEENNEELEDARKKIDQIFGLDDSATISLNSSPDSSLTLNSPTLLKNFEEKAKNRQSFGSPKFERKVAVSDEEVKSNNSQIVLNNSTFTRTKRRPPTVEEMLHNVETKLSEEPKRNAQNISNDLNGKQSNSSHINQFPSKNENQNNNNIINQLSGSNSRSAPTTPRSPLVSRKLVELRKNSRQNQNLSGIRRKNSWNSDMDYCESYNSDESTDQSHRSSNSALSKEGGNASTASVPSKINFNRAFALRRARLGIDTPGIDVTVKKSGFSRNDGGRFSLRAPKNGVNDSPKKLANRISSKEKLNNPIQRKGSDPYASINRQPVMSSVSDTERRNALNSNRFNQLNNRLRNNYNLNNSNNNNNNTNLSKNGLNSRQNTFTDSELSVARKPKQISANSGQQMTGHLNNFNNRRIDSAVNRDGNMSSSLTEPSHKPPINCFQTKNMSSKSGLELTALDGLVVSAINQLSQKLRNNLTTIMESQRSKHPPNSHARSMIDEVLPQLIAPDRRLNDNTISVSRDLSAILKNLKKVEHSLEAVNHLLEPNTTNTTKSHNSGRRQSNDFFVVDV